MHNDFTLFLREYPNGTKVYFYYAYDDKEERKGPWTTKATSKTEARNYCHALIRNGRLIPDRTKAMTFGEYAKGFWEHGSEYLRNQEGRKDITKSYIGNCQKMLDNQILPFFANKPLEDITDKAVNSWLLGFKKREVKDGGDTKIKQYKNTYANTVFGTLNVMLAEAVKKGLIKTNPCDNVQRLKNDRKKLEILTVGEVQKLFPKNYKTIWGNNEIAYAANRLASLTGMRAGEILGLRGEFVHDNYINVCGQYTEYGYGNTKTKESRTIPLIPEMIELLRKLMKQNGKGYVFSLDGGAKPVCRKYIYNEFHKALKKIGVDEKEIKRRGLSIHSWRHFLNTELQMQGLTIAQVQSVTGHKSDRMTEWYSHPDARQIEDVIKAQAAISGAKKQEKAEGKGLKIVKMPERKESIARKRA
jgi:integrase